MQDNKATQIQDMIVSFLENADNQNLKDDRGQERNKEEIKQIIDGVSWNTDNIYFPIFSEYTGLILPAHTRLDSVSNDSDESNL